MKAWGVVTDAINVFSVVERTMSKLSKNGLT